MKAQQKGDGTSCAVSWVLLRNRLQSRKAVTCPRKTKRTQNQAVLLRLTMRPTRCINRRPRIVLPHQLLRNLHIAVIAFDFRWNGWISALARIKTCASTHLACHYQHRCSFKGKVSISIQSSVRNLVGPPQRPVATPVEPLRSGHLSRMNAKTSLIDERTKAFLLTNMSKHLHSPWKLLDALADRLFFCCSIRIAPLLMLFKRPFTCIFSCTGIETVLATHT